MSILKNSEPVKPGCFRSGKTRMLCIISILVIIGIGAFVYSQKAGDRIADFPQSAETLEAPVSPRQNVFQKKSSSFRKPSAKASHSHGHRHMNDFEDDVEMSLPRDLEKRLSDLGADGNSYYTNPNYFQEVYDVVSNGRDMETTIDILKKYGIYTDVVLEYMDDYEAFKYINSNAPDTFGLEPAEKYAKRLLSASDSDVAWEAWTYLYYATKDPHEKETYILGGLKQFPENKTTLYMNMGMLYDVDAPEKAIYYLKKAKALNAGGSDFHLGIAYQRLGDYKTAWVHLKKSYEWSTYYPIPGMVGRHLDAIASGDPLLDPIVREVVPALSLEGAVPSEGGVGALPVLPSDFVEAIPMEDDKEASVSGHVSSDFLKEQARRCAFSELLREKEQEAEKAEAAKKAYFKDLEDFLNWAMSIESDAPIETDNFLVKELERHLFGEKTVFEPERIIRGFEMIEKYGEAEGLKKLQQLDPPLAKQVAETLNKMQVPPQKGRK